VLSQCSRRREADTTAGIPSSGEGADLADSCIWPMVPKHASCQSGLVKYSYGNEWNRHLIDKHNRSIEEVILSIEWGKLLDIVRVKDYGSRSADASAACCLEAAVALLAQTSAPKQVIRSRDREV
jgi:hypothetical protein